MIKNVTYKGVTLFLVELRKHLQNGTIGSGFWRETSGRTALPIHYTFKDIKHDTLWDLVNWFISNHEDVSDAEFNKLLMEFPSQFWILNRKGWFMLEVKDKSFVADKSNEVEIASSESELTTEIAEDTEQEVVVQAEQTDYDSLSDEALRELAKEAKIKGAHNMKRENLIAKLKA